jgi:hypothetical protein
VTVFANMLPTASQAEVQAAIQAEYTSLSPGAGSGFWSANAAPALSMAAGALVLIVPLLIFTAIDRNWF